jgi:hypothetical protein
MVVLVVIRVLSLDIVYLIIFLFEGLVALDFGSVCIDDHDVCFDFDVGVEFAIARQS